MEHDKTINLTNALNDSLDLFEEDIYQDAPSEINESIDIFDISTIHSSEEPVGDFVPSSRGSHNTTPSPAVSSDSSTINDDAVTVSTLNIVPRSIVDDSFDEPIIFLPEEYASDISDDVLNVTFATEDQNLLQSTSQINCLSLRTPSSLHAQEVSQSLNSFQILNTANLVKPISPTPATFTPLLCPAISTRNVPCSTTAAMDELPTISVTTTLIPTCKTTIPGDFTSSCAQMNPDTGTRCSSTSGHSSFYDFGPIPGPSGLSDIENLTNLRNLSTSTPIFSSSKKSRLPPSEKNNEAKKAHEDFTRKRDLIAAVMNSEDPDIGIGERYGSYMHLKKTKLQYQVNVLAKPKTVVSTLFQGVSIFVNGHTDPSALQLRELIQTHGGEYHCYLEYGKTTYTIASSLAAAKVNKARVNEIFLQPAWIVDSIGANEKLPIDSYILHSSTYHSSNLSKPITNFFTRPDSNEGVQDVTNREERRLDARDPNFLQEFYARSRLHLISTLAQEMKDYVNGIREDPAFECISLQNLSSNSEDRLSENIFFHIDLDCFFVSVALRSRSDLIGKPVAITHSKGSTNTKGMSEIASASYPARSQGLKNGMLVRDALKLCPSLICLPYSFDEYREVSKTIYTIVARYSKEIKAVSCDEMYVNMTKLCNENHISEVETLADHIRSNIRQETGCPASVGIGPTVLIARLATRYAKPNGVRWVRTTEVSSFVAKEKIANLPGIGYSMISKLDEVFGEMELCRDLQNISESELASLFGKKAGSQIYKLCRGEDNSEKDFLESTVRKSVSCDINYGIRFTKKEEVFKFLGVLGAELEKKLNMCRMLAGSLTLKLMVRSADAPVETAKYLGHGRCDSNSKSVLFKTHTKDHEFLTKEAIQLLNQMNPLIVDLRGIGVQCGRLKSETAPSTAEVDMRSFFRVRRPISQQRQEKLVVVEPIIPCKIRKSKFGGIIERDIPLANSLPVLFGEDNPFQIRQALKEMLLYEPTESVVFAVLDYLFDLMSSGCLNQLLALSKFLHRMVYGSDCHEGWFFAVHCMLHRIDNTLNIHHGCHMIIPVLNTISNI